jgi:hypothetical protein
MSDWLMPAVYQHGYNSQPNDDEAWGEWTGKAIQSGTYNVGLFPRSRFYVKPDRTLGVSGDTDDVQYYSASSVAPGGDVLVIGVLPKGATTQPTALKAYDLIESAATCNACHNEVWLHGRKGADTCLTCHGTAGFGRVGLAGVGDRSARTFAHKVHMGEELTNAATYEGGDFEHVVPGVRRWREAVLQVPRDQ